MADTITYKRGDTWRAVFTYTGVDLTGCSARAQIRNKRDDTLYLSGSSTSGELVVDGVAGTITMRFEPEVTVEVPVGTHEADIEVTYSDGTVESSDTFLVKVLEDITR